MVARSSLAPRIAPVVAFCVLAAVGRGQAPGWSPRPSFVPAAKAWVASGSALLATDVARGVIVSFGAYGQGGSLADTWEWGGGIWTPRASAAVPPPRVGARLVHDPVRRRAVLFGGADPGTANLRGDLWEWDGASWSQRVLPGMPSPRERYGMAFDAARGRIVLHGGRIVTAGIGANDTWEYDGASWVQRAPANAPGWRIFHALAYDTARQCVVTFGGYPAQDETWEWDGSTWHLRATGGPQARIEHTLLYDAARQRTVLCGGSLLGASGQAADTWEWNGAQWQQRAASLPFPLIEPAAATDPASGVAQVFHDDAVWRWNGTAWAAAQSVSMPPANLLGATACTDTLRSRVVTFGRHPGGATAAAQTFEWDGSAWTRSPATGPTGALLGACAFDSGRACTVLVGGENNLSQVWEWNGVTWVARQIAPAPSLRSGHGLAYDVARQCCVMFGGEFNVPMAGPVYLDQTWTYDGLGWTQRTGPAPAARAGHAMAYDPVRQRVVLFGGAVYGFLEFDDTWEWDGTAWTQRTPSVRPSPRHGAGMAFDAVRNATVLFGGFGSGQVLGDTWEWNGSVWGQVAPSRTPPARLRPAMAIDPLTLQVMVHGGIVSTPSTTAARDDTWVLGSPVLASATELGTACAAGAPPVLATATPYLGNTDFGFEIHASSAATPCALGISFVAQAQPFGPCTLWLQAGGVAQFTLANAHGVARVALPIPHATWLRGVQMTAQAGVLAAPGAWSGVDLTAARTIVIGD